MCFYPCHKTGRIERQEDYSTSVTNTIYTCFCQVQGLIRSWKCLKRDMKQGRGQGSVVFSKGSRACAGKCTRSVFNCDLDHSLLLDSGGSTSHSVASNKRPETQDISVGMRICTNLIGGFSLSLMKLF